MTLRVLDLFSGIGGFSLGLERTGGFETVAFCEIEEFPRRVLAKHWPEVPIHEDVRKLTAADVGPVDVICGGYPCQPFSTAGKRRGKEDDRHLWPEFNRLVAELRPTWVIGENVAGHISMGLDDVLSDLEGQGYACRTFVIPACAVDAPHRRDRCWVVAHRDDQPRQAVRGEREALAGESGRGRDGRSGSISDAEREVSNGCAGENPGALAHPSDMQRNGEQHFRATGAGQVPQSGAGSREDDLANTMREYEQGEQPWGFGSQEWAQQGEGQARSRGDGFRQWPVEPGVGRVAPRLPGGVDRLKALGNSVVPAVVEVIGHAILRTLPSLQQSNGNLEGVR